MCVHNRSAGECEWHAASSALRKRNALSVLITEWQWQTGHAASSAKSVAEAECHMCVNNGIADEWQWQTGHAASSAK